MPRRDGAATRAEKTLVRRQRFFQDRIDQAKTPVEVISAGAGYLLSVICKVYEVNPSKADEIAQDTTEYLLRQARAHDGGTR